MYWFKHKINPPSIFWYDYVVGQLVRTSHRSTTHTYEEYRPASHAEQLLTVAQRNQLSQMLPEAAYYHLIIAKDGESLSSFSYCFVTYKTIPLFLFIITIPGNS